MSEILLNTRDWPVVVVIVPKEFTEAEWQAYYEASIGMLARRQAFVTINDLRGSQPPNARQRAMFTDAFARDESAMKTYLKGSAMIVDSQITRGVITAMGWVRPPPFPFLVCKTPEEAQAWAKAQIAKLV